MRVKPSTLKTTRAAYEQWIDEHTDNFPDN